jgi:hypothetical protein
MGEIVNLRRARKKQARVAAENQAAANRVAFGRSRDENRRIEAEREFHASRLDAHRVDKPADDGA